MTGGDQGVTWRKTPLLTLRWLPQRKEKRNNFSGRSGVMIAIRWYINYLFTWWSRQKHWLIHTGTALFSTTTSPSLNLFFFLLRQKCFPFSTKQCALLKVSKRKASNGPFLFPKQQDHDWLETLPLFCLAIIKPRLTGFTLSCCKYVAGGIAQQLARCKMRALFFKRAYPSHFLPAMNLVFSFISKKKFNIG